MQLSEAEKNNSSPNESNLNYQKKSPPKNKSVGFVNVLRNKQFFTLWIGQIFSQLADKIYLVLMIAIISSNFQQQGQSISGWVSLIMIAFTIPAVLFGSLAGVYVDRWSKKAVLVVSNLARGVLVLLIPFLLLMNNLGQGWFNLPWDFWLLLLITFLVSTLTQFFAPAEQATLPLIIKKQDLLAANSIYTTTMMGMLIVGFAVGDPLLEIVNNWGKNLSFNFGKELLVGTSYAIAGLILFVINTQERQQDRQTEEKHPLQDIKEGIQYLQTNHKVRNALFLLIILFSVFAALAVLAVRLAETIPGMEADQFGFLLATTGVGIGIGGTVATHQGKSFSHRQLSFWGSLGMGTSLLGLSLFTHSLIMTLIMTGLLGMFAALIGVPMQTTIQAETPPEMRGKVFGLQNNAVNIALSLPLALAGIAETWLGLRTVLVILSIFTFAGSIFTLINPQRLKK
jgi:MFS family permease